MVAVLTELPTAAPHAANAGGGLAPELVPQVVTPPAVPEPTPAPVPVVPALAVPPTEAKSPKPRKLTEKQRRQARADRMRAYRDEKKAKLSPPADPVVKARQTAADEAAAAAAARAAAETKARNEKMLRDAIAGTVASLADSAQLLFLDNSRPHLGKARAAYIADLWVPVLAPHINESNVKWVAMALVAGGTSSVIFEWAHEYSAAAPAEGEA